MEESTRTLKLLQHMGRGYITRKENRIITGPLRDMLIHEFKHNKNISILYYMNRHYGLHLWNVTKRAYEHTRLDFEAYCLGYATIISQNKAELSLNDIILEFLSKEPGIFADEVIKHLSKVSETTKMYGIWLTTETAADRMVTSKTGKIEEHTIPQNALIVCDSDDEGILFALTI